MLGRLDLVDRRQGAEVRPLKERWVVHHRDRMAGSLLQLGSSVIPEARRTAQDMVVVDELERESRVEAGVALGPS